MSIGLKLLKEKIKCQVIFLIVFSFLNMHTYAEEIESYKNELDLNTINVKKNNVDYKSEYILDSGDGLFIEFKGIDFLTNIYKINPEGYLILPELDKFYASGLTIEELRDKLLVEYTKYIINPAINISISKYRSVNVYVYGEVNNPGLYRISDSTIFSELNNDFKSNQNNEEINNPRLFNALQFAKGVTADADIENIKIIRKNTKSKGGGKISANINLLNLITKGDQSQNIRILDGDSIFIPKSKRKIKEQILAIQKTNLSPNEIVVFVTGNVENPGDTTLKKGATLVQAIYSKGGGKIFTGNIEIIRFKDDGTTFKNKFKFNPIAKKNTAENPTLMDGDIINVKKNIIGHTTKLVNEISSPVISAYGIYKIFED